MTDQLQHHRRLLVSISHLRWVAAGLSLVLAYLSSPIVSARGAVLVSVALALYNIPAALGRRLPARVVQPLLLSLVVADFAVCTSWTFLTANDPHVANFVMFAIVGIEAAVLFGWVGTGIFSGAVVMTLFALNVERQAVYGFPFNVGSLVFRTGIIVMLALLVGLITAQSERRRQALEDHAVRLERLEKAKSDFLRLASHELRGPITVLRGYFSMLLDGSLPPEKTGEAMATMEERLSFMEHLVSQMVDAARLEDARLELRLEDLGLKSIVEHAATFERRALKADQRLELELPPDDIQVHGDASRLLTVVMNLIDNAIKYSPEGTSVTCRLLGGDGQAVLSVEDQGAGIADEHRSLLFTRFGRLPNDASVKVAGTGLGLYLAREIARLHGGEVEVSSAAGCGSTFTLRLPTATPTS